MTDIQKRAKKLTAILTRDEIPSNVYDQKKKCWGFEMLYDDIKGIYW